MSAPRGFFRRLVTGVLIIILAVGAYYAGRWTGPPQDAQPGSKPGTEVAADQAAQPAPEGAKKPQWWTCSMHPQIKLPSPEMKCPICFMDLIPVEEGKGEEGVPEISFSERARYLAEVQTATVERRAVTRTLRFVGKIAADETRLAMISSRVMGRLERLFVDYTGIMVRKGDHLVEIYSPQLFSAQQELLQAIAAANESKSNGSDMIHKANDGLVRASKERLTRLGLTGEQVEEVIQSGVSRDTITVYSPTAGIVLKREGTEGMYVVEGTPIYTIADLSEVWLQIDAYESDMQWLHYGQRVEFEAEAFPGEHFAGTLSFISPVLDEQSRTVKLRINVSNSDGRLKPGMFARATLQTIPAEGGKVMAPELALKWICPMHPEIVEDLFGHCPVCGMPLETAKSLGYEVAPTGENLPLVIPDTAPLITGKRAVVYVEEKREDDVYYTGRIVELGPHADGYYVVEDGLTEGEQVVVRGNFKIDSALQILAKPSMMSPPGGEAGTKAEAVDSSQPAKPFEIGEEIGNRLKPALICYLALQTALAEDSFERALKSVGELWGALANLAAEGLADDAKAVWERDANAIRQVADESKSAANIEILREKFDPLSKAVNDLVRHFGNVTDGPLRYTFCPMALENGAFWLQSGKIISNPYYGASMLRCGEFRATYPVRFAKEVSQ